MCTGVAWLVSYTLYDEGGWQASADCLELNVQLVNLEWWRDIQLKLVLVEVALGFLPPNFIPYSHGACPQLERSDM